MDPPASSRPKDTCWAQWLKHRKRMCPFLENISTLSSRVEFMELLAAAGHSYVFKVRLENKIYALKLPHWSARRFEINAWEMDPFIVECRVYDCLIEKKLVGTVGPYCRGWLTIDKTQESQIDGILRRTLEWRRRSDTAEDPVRGLLLEYIEGCTLDKATITALQAQSLRDQLNHLHSLNIAHGDLFSRNIIVSKEGRAVFIDFSAAYLWPHTHYTIRKWEDFQLYVRSEKCTLELFFFRLQKLRRHQGVILTEANTEEEAYGCRVSDWANVNYTFTD